MIEGGLVKNAATVAAEKFVNNLWFFHRERFWLDDSFAVFFFVGRLCHGKGCHGKGCHEGRHACHVNLKRNLFMIRPFRQVDCNV